MDMDGPLEEELDEVEEMDTHAQLDEDVEVDAHAQLDEDVEVDAHAQLDEVVEMDTQNSWTSQALAAQQLRVHQGRFRSTIRKNKAEEVERLHSFRHMHFITQRASWIIKLWYANMAHPKAAPILEDQDVIQLLNALNWGDITRACSEIFEATLNHKLAHTICYTATSLITNLEVIVSVNFMKKLRQYVERRFRLKEILRSFNHVTDKPTHIFLRKRLQRRFNQPWRLITDQVDLPDGQLPAMDDVFYNIWGETWNILPSDPKRHEYNLA
ncbi:hypothetical protein HDU87_002451 [Geranomyces variabilis]|uniref:Uncharacterized protein n=1 Tax=Geranomyces variabilis TaxID=109894 RepID=A0AAD5TR96_9FUNG|nr:hypothetical protein HDU87_002451 [Geranomyces variabilis]